MRKTTRLIGLLVLQFTLTVELISSENRNCSPNVCVCRKGSQGTECECPFYNLNAVIRGGITSDSALIHCPSNPISPSRVSYFSCENQIKFEAVRRLEIANCQCHTVLNHLKFTNLQEYSEIKPRLTTLKAQFSLAPNVNNLSTLKISNHNSLNLQRKSFSQTHKTLSTLIVKNSLKADIDVDSFADLVNLEHLELSNCNIGNLSGLLKYSRRLRKLNLNNNELESVVFDDFANLANLEELNLSYNKLTQLPLGIFDHFPNLTKTFLDCNPLTSLPAMMFQKNPSVSSFSLSGKACYNKIVSLDLTPRMFYSHTLRSITIRNIKIDSFSPDWLDDCSGLKSLTLTECNIRTFSGQIFIHSPNVRHLLLSHNGLRHLFLDGRNLPRLENLDVKFNRLDDSFFLNPRLKFHQLETWNISHNRVKNLTHVFKLLSLSPSLAKIDISHNRIASLPKDLNSTLGTSLPRPRKVLMNIAGNSLPCDCNLRLVKLKLVSGSKANSTGISFSDFNVKCGATSIRLSSMPDSDLRCPLVPGELQGVDLCDSWISGPEEVVSVNCSSRGLTLVPTIRCSRKRIEIDMSHNNISRLEAKLPDNISKIDLSHNFLETVPDPELLPSSLESLSLKNNRIHSLKDASLNYFKSFESLTLGSNPLTLNCTETSQLEVIKNLNNVEDKQDIILRIGKTRQQKPLLSTSTSDICPQNSKSLLVSILILCCCTLVIIGLVAKQQTKMIKRCLLIARTWFLSFLKDSHHKIMFKRRGYQAVLYEEIKEEKSDYKHQIFLLYCEQDEDFVERSLLKTLHTLLNENSICLPGRDWAAGERAVDQLSESIRESERVMAVITESFIRDPWCVLQFTLAMRERLTLPVSGIIVLLHKEPRLSEMPQDMRTFVKLVTHVKSGDEELEEKLRKLFSGAADARDDVPPISKM